MGHPVYSFGRLIIYKYEYKVRKSDIIFYSMGHPVYSFGRWIQVDYKYKVRESDIICSIFDCNKLLTATVLVQRSKIFIKSKMDKR